MLSPLREPAYAATARTVSGSLCELERVIGDSLFTGYVGYNGRAPGGATAFKKDDIDTTNDRNKTGGDARHTLVAYFEIVELAGILDVDRETVNLAVRIFRHTANSTSLRNRNVESLATAAFVAASERRYEEYKQWLKSETHTLSITTCKNDASSSNVVITDRTTHAPAESNQSHTMWPVKPRHLTVDEVAIAANLEVSEVQRYLKVVNTALRKHRQEGSSSIMAHMPAFCRQLDLPQRTRTLAIDIVDRIVKFNVCHRRNPVSVAAAAIYLACQLDSVRKTQTEICRVTSLTEVTLRKVHKELNVERKKLIPDWFERPQSKHPTRDAAVSNPANSVPARSTNTDEHRKSGPSSAPDREDWSGGTNEPNAPDVPSSLIPPPLPPGFAKDGQASISPGKNAANSAKSSPEPSIPSNLHPKSQMGAGPTKDNSQNPAALLTMFNFPAYQAFTNAMMSQMPQLMAPPQPPPLPDTGKLSSKEKLQESANTDEQKKRTKTSDDSQKLPTATPGVTNRDSSLSAASNSEVPAPPLPPELPDLPAVKTPVRTASLNATPTPGATYRPVATPVLTPGTPAVPGALPDTLAMPDASTMANFQSMMGMMQMMFQTAQQMGANGSTGSAPANPFAMMSAMMSQMQNASANDSTSGPAQTRNGKADENIEK